MKLSVGSAILLLATMASASPAPRKTTSTKQPTKPTPPPSTPAKGWHNTNCVMLPAYSQTCQVAQVDASDTAAQEATYQTYLFAKSELNQWWGALGKNTACYNTLPETWQAAYCRMGPKGIGGIKVSTWVQDIRRSISCYDLQQSLECMDCSSGPGIMGGWDLSFQDVKRYVKIEKPTEADRANCMPCPAWGDQQCA